ncbi:flagellar hook-length control protein FliK [Sphingomonas sp. ST-64]|uniref:Flagellar hook-length control protein FliK n=1 Tax=Sphingomonas plantiphila TaxID=3163295 RepID=A0ABW8YIL0_9SPHN
MPNLLATPALPALGPAILSRTAPVALPDQAPIEGGFALALNMLALPGGKLPGKGDGKAIAEGGKDLPEAGIETDTDTDDAEPVLAWLPGQPIPLPEKPSLPGAALASVPDSAADSVLVNAGADQGPPCDVALPALAEEVAVGSPIAGDPATAGESPVPDTAVDTVVETPDPVNGLRPRSATVPAQAEPRVGGGEHSARGEQPVAPGPLPIAATALPHSAAPLHSGPAAQIFAAALADAAEPVSRTTEPVVIEGQTARALEVQRTSVQAIDAADEAPLDLTRDAWAGKMIDRIATLRDAAEAADTRIRLAPEHLGSVEVSIRRDGDRLHVHFNAENPATRQLLAEAAPRLAELADSRGVKLGQTSVGGGTGGQDGRHDAPPSHRNSQARPASAAAAATGPAADARVA